MSDKEKERERERERSDVLGGVFYLVLIGQQTFITIARQFLEGAQGPQFNCAICCVLRNCIKNTIHHRCVFIKINGQVSD